MDFRTRPMACCVSPVRALLVLCGLVISLLSSGSSLFAQNLYTGVDIGGGLIRVPNHQFFVTREDAAPFTKLGDIDYDDGDSAGIMVGGRVGYNVGMPLMGAYKSRVELNGFWLGTEDTVRASFFDNDPNGGFGWVPISVTAPFLTADGETLNTQVSSRIDYGGYDIILKQDYRFNDGEIFTIYGGFSAQYLYQDYATQGEIGTRFVNLAEELNTNYHGGKIGVRHERDFWGPWFFAADANVSFLKADTKYQTHYVDSDTRIIDQRLRSQQDALGSQVQLEMGRNVSQATRISAFTTFNYLSYAPQVGFGASGGTSPPDGVPQILDRDMYALMIGLKLITTW